MSAVHFSRRGHAAACIVLVCAAETNSAFASNPLEYPDNGSAAFSRGGAWLALANEPIAAHYNPAALATQASGFSLEQQLNFTHTCFERSASNGANAGPDAATSTFIYERACSARTGFPNAIPSIALAFRAGDRLGVGIAIVPPAAYGTAQGEFPVLARGKDTISNASVDLPAPYRYLELEQQSAILFPTLGIGWEIADHFRLGAGFISGIGVINTSAAAVSTLGIDDAAGDHMADDSLSTLRTRDLFVPGVVVSLQWSILPVLDVALWGRWIDSIRSSSGSLDIVQQPFNGNGQLNPPCAGTPGAGGRDYSKCTSNQSVPNHFDDAVAHFEYPIPPEIRWGARFHRPRSVAEFESRRHRTERDSLHDDVFDVELDQTLTLSSYADTIEVRFKQKDGKGALTTNPTNVPVPPNADRATGYNDSIGFRLGGQWNPVPDFLGLRAGAWFESRSQDPRLLTIAPVGAVRWGFGGGVVARVGLLDISAGYQRHLCLGLDNHGNGKFRAPAGTGDSPEFDLDREPARIAAEDRTQFRTQHAVNGGKVSFDAHVFTLGGLVRF